MKLLATTAILEAGIVIERSFLYISPSSYIGNGLFLYISKNKFGNVKGVFLPLLHKIAE
jgi:hypothetical protein